MKIQKFRQNCTYQVLPTNIKDGLFTQKDNPMQNENCQIIIVKFPPSPTQKVCSKQDYSEPSERTQNQSLF